MHEKLGLWESKPTRMSLELADRSIQYPRGIAENVLIKIDKFILPIDFVILDMREDSRIPIILGRPFLTTARAIIDVFNKKIILRVGSEEVIFDVDQSIKKPPAEDDECYGIDNLDITIHWKTHKLLKHDQMDSFLVNNLEGNIDQSDFKSCESQETQGPVKMQNEHLYSTSANEIDEKWPELKDLPSHLEYAYLKGNESSSRMSFGLCNALATFQRCMTAIHDMVEDFMEVFMDDFSVFGNSFDWCLNNLDKMLASKQDVKPWLIRWVPLLQGFNIEIKDKKGQNLAADHLSRLEIPNIGELTEEEIVDEFLDEHLMILKSKLNDDEPWYANYVNYIVRKVVPLKWTPKRRNRCVAGDQILKILEHCHSGQTGGHRGASVTGRKVYETGFYWPSIFKDAKDYVMKCEACQKSRNISS
uniref:Integrase zinc-binding domain-containing protein n=1 Tax=Tanacetum cinerariifolium TaxID=118510 RepID=A0A6L2K8N6_TANCI|nr:hypothetical protein [Tanacetum cinerariifolium]